MLQAEREEFVHLIFSQNIAFEKYVLNVYNDDHKIEIMTILSKRIIQSLLKEELNFLYMKDMENFKFSLIKNILYKEISYEWISYAKEKLAYSHINALETLQEKKKVVFLVNFIKKYFKEYNTFFFEEIADSFIELIYNMPNQQISNALIDEVLVSEMVKYKGLSVVYSYSQLWGRVRNAHQYKKYAITKLQIKISENAKYKNITKYEIEEELLEDKPLAYFDDALMRLRHTMVLYMKQLRT